MQHNYISVKYTSDPQSEVQVVSVLIKPLHSQWNQGTIKEGIHPTTQLRRHSPCTWPYSRSRYCRHLWRKSVFTVSIMWRYVPGYSFCFTHAAKAICHFSPWSSLSRVLSGLSVSLGSVLSQLKLISIIYCTLPSCFCAQFLYRQLQAWHIQTLRLGYKSQYFLAKQWLKKLIQVENSSVH